MDTAGCQTKGQPDVPGSRGEWWLLTSIGITLPPSLQGVVKPQLCRVSHWVAELPGDCGPALTVDLNCLYLI